MPGQSACTYSSRLHPHAAVIHLHVQSQSSVSGRKTLGAVQQRLQASRLGAHGGLRVGHLLFGQWLALLPGERVVMRSSSAFEVLDTGRLQMSEGLSCSVGRGRLYPLGA